MRPEQVVEHHVAAWNSHDPDAFNWVDDIEWVVPGAHLRGRSEALGFLAPVWEAMPDARLEITRLIGDGSILAGEGTLRATQGGSQIEIRWMAMFEVRGDQLAAEHLYFDPAELPKP